MPHLTLADGDHLYYEAQGSGPPLLLITGVHGLASFWPRAMVDRLARRYTVILHDQRGTGQSSRSHILYSLTQMCSDVLRLCDGLGIRRAHIVGHSLGGAIAQTLALDYPGRVDRLVLSATWAGPDPYFQGLIALRRDMLAHGDWDLYARFSALLMHPSPWVREHAAEQLGPAPAAPDSVTRAIMVDRLQVVLAHDRRAELGRVTAPTLVVGARDDIWTPAYLSVELGRLIPNAETLILPEGQHFFPQVVPERFVAILDAFLAQTTPAIHATSASGFGRSAP
jgi:aminoacrylate hydrolase